MQWYTYLVAFSLCVSGDSRLDIRKTPANNCDQDVTAKSNDTIACSVRLESKSSDNGFLKGKNCLRNLDNCVAEDISYHTSARHLINYLTTAIAPFKMYSLKGVRQECQQSSQKFAQDLSNFEYWALQMYDATAKLPSGLLSGNVLQFGDFDLCMNSKNLAENIYGQYCLANIQFEVPNSAYLAGIYNLIHSHGIIRSKLSDPSHRVPRFSSIQWGICVPHNCNPKDVDIGLNQVLGRIFNGTEIQYSTLVDSSLCSSAKPEAWPTTTILALLFFLILLLFEIFSTICEIYWKSNNRVILSFSIKNNWRKLCSLKNENDIDAIHIVRFINGIMLMAAHKSMALLFLPYINRTTTAESLGETWTVIGRAASLYTDPFIMLSGTLTAYSVIGKLKESKRFNIIEEYISRILRILPTLAALILFCTLVLPWANAGPLWKSVVTHHSNICKQHWWRNMLFIHNYFGFENMCLTHTHHVGIDTQLFFLSPLFILLIWKKPKYGVVTLSMVGAVSTWMRYNSTYTRNLSNYVYYGATIKKLFLTADYMYIIPVYRLTVYVMGIILGYLLKEYKNIKFKPVHIYIGNFFAILCLGGALIAPSFMGHFDYIYNSFDAAWYAAYGPILWCLGFAWFIYITHIGHTGYIDPILRNPIPKMWTKISYTAYLTQFPVYFYNVGITKHADEFGVFAKQLNFLEFFWIMFFSLILTLFIEIPSQNIRDCIFKKPKSLEHSPYKEKVK